MAAASDKSAPTVIETTPQYSKTARREFESHQKEKKEGQQGYAFAGQKNENMSKSALPRDVDMTAPELKAAWVEVSGRKPTKNWLVFGFNGEKGSNKLGVVATGKGGFSELEDLLSGREAQAQALFGAFAVKGLAKTGSIQTERVKIVYFSWVGSGCSELVRASAAPLRAKVAKFFGAVSLTLEVKGSALDLFTPSAVGWKLMSAEGSHKSTHLDFGDGKNVLDCAKLHHDSDDEEDDEYDSD